MNNKTLSHTFLACFCHYLYLESSDHNLLFTWLRLKLVLEISFNLNVKYCPLRFCKLS